MCKYIGIDISKATLDVYDGKHSHKFPNNTRGFKQILKLASAKEACWIFEPTGVYSHAIVAFCQQHRIKAHIVGSKEARDYARSIKQRSKTDKIDAQVLYRYHTQLDPKALQVPTINLEARRLTQRRNAWDQTQEAIQKFRNLMESIDPKDKALLRSLHKQIAALEKSADALAKELKAMILEHGDNAQHFEHLQTIPGVGEKSALSILLEVIRYPYASSKEMTALMGLDPVFRDSGNFRGKIRISKQGGNRLRHKLYMATVSAIRYNDRLKIFYERLVTNGKPKKLALMAAMRKLLMMAMAIIRKQEPYQALA